MRVLESVLSERADLGPTESWLERETLRILGEAGLPLPEVQQVIRRRGAFVSRVDFLYRRPQVVVEVEGKVHDAPEQRTHDHSQRNRLQLLGHATLTFTYQQVVRTPEVLVRDVGEMLAQRAARPGRASSF